MKRLLPILAAASLALAAHGGIAEASCHPVFVAGQGVLDSCTGDHWDSERYAPPEPTVIQVTVAPTINVTVSPVVTVSNVVSSTASAGALASSGSSSTVVVTHKAKHFPPKVTP